MTNRSIIALVAACMLVAGFLSTVALAAGGTELQAARQELRLRSETERRMRRDFESLLGDSQMSATEISEFENYLARLGKMVDEQRRLVADLEGRGADSATGSSQTAALPGNFDRGQTDDEKVALLDAELGSSLSEFDEKLLREQKELAAKSRSASAGESGDQSEPGDGASGKAGDGRGVGEKAAGESRGEAGESASGSAAGSSGKDGESERQGESGEQGGTGDEGAEGNEQVASAGGASGDGRHAGTIPTPPDIPDGKDDDIVARQLREAAENEQDPELRKKLWEEYRKYKNRSP